VCRYCLAVAMLLAGASVEAAILRSAHATIEIVGDGTCDVQIQFVTVSDAPATVRHTLLASESARVDEVSIAGAAAGDVVRQGRTLVVPVSLGAGETVYTARYRVQQQAGAGWCSLLVPDAPTAGASRAVQIDAAIPAGTQRLPGEFPAMSWEDRRGTARLGHMPAFTTLPHAAKGEAVSWRRSFDVRRTLDSAAVLFLVGASVIWAVSRRQRR
jgi:hypothetical protein